MFEVLRPLCWWAEKSGGRQEKLIKGRVRWRPRCWKFTGCLEVAVLLYASSICWGFLGYFLQNATHLWGAPSDDIHLRNFLTLLVISRSFLSAPLSEGKPSIYELDFILYILVTSICFIGVGNMYIRSRQGACLSNNRLSSLWKLFYRYQELVDYTPKTFVCGKSKMVANWKC